MIDVAIVSIPRIAPVRPAAAPPLLKSICNQTGQNVSIQDQHLGHNGVWKIELCAPKLVWIIKEQNPSGIHLEDTIFSTSSSTLEDVKKFFAL